MPTLAGRIRAGIQRRRRISRADRDSSGAHYAETMLDDLEHPMPEGFSHDTMRQLFRGYIIPGMQAGLSTNERNRLTNNSGCGMMPNSRRSTMPNMQEEWRWFTSLSIGPETVHGTRVKMVKDDRVKMSVLIEDPADVIEWIWVANDYGAYIADPSGTWQEAIGFICEHAHRDRMSVEDAELEFIMDDMPDRAEPVCQPPMPTPMGGQRDQTGQPDGYARMALGYGARASTSSATGVWTVSDSLGDMLRHG